MRYLLLFIPPLLLVVFSKGLWAQSTIDDDQKSASQAQKVEQIDANASDDEAKIDGDSDTFDQEKQRTSQSNRSASDKNKDKVSKVSSSNKNSPNKVFIPTEEISEDKPVAFPVDI